MQGDNMAYCLYFILGL